MNTGKQINAMVVVLFLLVLATGFYAVWDPFRADTKAESQADLTLERAAGTFALNCRTCHGDRGQGGVDGGRLDAAPALDGPNLQGIDDNGDFSQAELDADFKFVVNTVTCGRAGTKMPIWGQSQGGTLTTTQIDQLARMITEGKWDPAQEHADELDAETVGHVTLQMPDGSLPPDATEVIVSNAAKLTDGQYIRIPIDLENEERMRILPKQLAVQRAVGGTAVAEHAVGATITIIGAPPLAEGENPPTLAELMDDAQTTTVVGSLDPFAAGDTIQIEDERMRITATEQGLPTTGQVLAEDIGREPGTFLASGAEGIDAGSQIRIDGELMEVEAVNEDGNPDIQLDADLSADTTRISVTNPSFFTARYVVRIGDELIEVERPVEVGQLLAQQLGRAETSILVTGTEGIREGMLIRMGPELMRVSEIVQPAQIEITRAQQDTAAAAHAAGTAVLKQVAADDDGQPVEEPDTGQQLLTDVSGDATVVDVTATSGIAVGQTYVLDAELVEVTATSPALLRVERAAGGTEAAVHSRRVTIFDGNLLDVERGVQGTTAAAHSAGDELFMTEVEVKRAAGGTKPEDHSKNADIFLGNSLLVQRGVKETQPEEHQNGAEVLDFPLAPDNPATTGDTCGQLAPAEGPTGPAPTAQAGATQISVELVEFEVTPDPDSGGTGPYEFAVTNDGSGPHNFRVIQTDLEPDALPVTGTRVDESAVNVVAASETIPAGQSASVGEQLDAGGYVLICNVPGHYESGMYAGFQVQ